MYAQMIKRKVYLMTMIALFSTGIGIRLFRRKERHDLYGRTSRRNDLDDYDAKFGIKE